MRTSKPVKEGTSMETGTMTATIRQPRPRDVSPPQQYGPRQAGDGVMLVASFPQAKAVSVAGDFNNWQPEKTPMQKAADGAWQVKINLTKGTYRYRLVVDGRWQQDPHNSKAEPNPYGELNSVLEVR